MTLKEVLDSNFPPYFMYGKVLASQNGSFRLEHSISSEKVYVAPETLEQICREREEVLKMLEKIAEALRKAHPVALDLMFDQEIEG